VKADRGVMARHLIVQMCVERERALANGTALAHATWSDLADSLVDALTCLWSAPVTP
jgi:hypothetical protein